MHSDSLAVNFRAIGAYIKRVTHGLSDEQMMNVPAGHRNNLLWNLGHLVVDTCDMLYVPAGLDPPHPSEYVPLFDAGTAPADWAAPPDVAEVRNAFDVMTERLASDYLAGHLAAFDPAKTHTGWPMKDLDQTLAYATIHEGIHLGIMLSIRKLVT